jgi:hypothetical protein
MPVATLTLNPAVAITIHGPYVSLSAPSDQMA